MIPSRSKLSGPDRLAAFLLAMLWLAGGMIAIGFGFVRDRWGLAIAGLFAVAYGGAWLRVAARSRLLSWRSRRAQERAKQ